MPAVYKLDVRMSRLHSSTDHTGLQWLRRHPFHSSRVRTGDALQPPFCHSVPHHITGYISKEDKIRASVGVSAEPPTTNVYSGSPSNTPMSWIQPVQLWWGNMGKRSRRESRRQNTRAAPAPARSREPSLALVNMQQLTKCRMAVVSCREDADNQ